MDWLSFNEMIIIKDEDNLVRNGGNLVDQWGQDDLGRWRLRRLEHCQCPCSEGCLQSLDLVQGCDEVCQETNWVVVAFIQ